MSARALRRIGDGRARPYLLRGGTFAILWWVISEGAVAAWLIGAPTVLAATWISLRLAPPNPNIRLSPVGLLRFIAYFARESLRGGIDVAGRVLSPRLRIAPGMVEHRPVLPEGPALSLFVVCISLLPGTLSVSQRGALVELHVLDRHALGESELATLERMIGGVFSLPGNRHD
jgi:multicomponent Na+:H+ antiporter subunit E